MRVRRYVTAAIDYRLLQRTGISVVGEYAQSSQAAILVRCIIDHSFDAIVLRFSDVHEGLRKSAWNLLGLVVEAYVKYRQFGRQLLAFPTRAGLDRLRQFRNERVVRRMRIKLQVLYRAE